MTHIFNLEKQTRLYRHKKSCYLLCEDTKTATLIKDSNIRRQNRYRLPKFIITDECLKPNDIRLKRFCYFEQLHAICTRRTCI